MSELGYPYLEGDNASNSRRNATSVISAPGSILASLPADQEIPIGRALDSTGGLKQDEGYLRSADGLTWLNFRRKHLHNEETDEAGGLMLNMFIHNPKLTIFGQRGFNTLDEYVVTKASTAAMSEQVNDTVGRYHQLQTVATINNYINASVAGTPLALSEKMLAIFKLQMEFDVNQVSRIGFGMEEANAGIDITPKAGMEMCTGTGIVWQGVTGDGVARTVTPTVMGVKPTPLQMRAYRIFYNPYSGEVKLANSDGQGKLITSNVPSGGIIEPKRLWRQGIMTTTAQIKNMWLQRVWWAAKNGDALWFDQPEDAVGNT